MILNPFKCEACKEELQPEDILLDTNRNGELIRVCKFCYNEVKIEQVSKGDNSEVEK